MTNDQLNRERLEKIKSWRETYGAGSNVMLPAEEAEELARIALAAMDSEPVAFINGAWTLVYYRPPKESGLKIGDKLYRHAQQPVVPDNTQHFDTIALETAEEIMCDVNRRHEFLGGEIQLPSRIQCRIDDACRTAMLQAGNSPVIPDGLIAAVNRLLDSDGSRGCYSAIRCHDARAEVERLLAAAPQEVK
ncbi:hypothetical protein ABN151_00655 [Klebsiella oxytoca]|uniref:hypothetical protein n=1 Tax=Klebsiella oxytoca TaxID=571 RepID=UPI0032DB976C